jgi:hypothetical protein
MASSNPSKGKDPCLDPQGTGGGLLRAAVSARVEFFSFNDQLLLFYPEKPLSPQTL